MPSPPHGSVYVSDLLTAPRNGHVGRVSGPEALLAGADLQGSVDRCGVDDPVSRLSGPGGVRDRFSDEIYLLVRAQNLELGLVHDVRDVPLAPPSAAQEALVAVPAHSGDRGAGCTGIFESPLHFV
jgi:hypothetical protein